MIELGKDTYIEGDLLIQTYYDEPTLSITISQLDSMNETVTYDIMLLGTYIGQTEDLIDDMIGKYERDKKRVE